MGVISRGFGGRRRESVAGLPPGQYLAHDFPVLSAGPTQRVPLDRWHFTVTSETGAKKSWTWAGFMMLPHEDVTVDIHCVTKWSKLGTSWRGVPLDTILADVQTEAEHAMVHSFGGYTTNVPLADLRGGKAWIAYQYEGDDLTPEHGGPARLLIPHLYLWKSAKWVNGLQLMHNNEPGFWETAGYHMYGDPWLEQRYQGD